mgnify:CR=1 FL=1
MERVIAAMYLIAAVIFGLLSLYEGVQTFLQLVALTQIGRASCRERV